MTRVSTTMEAALILTTALLMLGASIHAMFRVF
jgi:hypothetical protein